MKVLSAVPGPTSVGPIIRQFCGRGEGVVTAFSDSALPVCKRFVQEDDAVEVLALGEVVSRFLRMCGESAQPLSQAGQVEAAIARACLELPAESPFSRTARYPGLHKALNRTLKELHEWEIDRDEMLDLASVATPRLSAKLQSLAEIDKEVDSVMLALGRQSHSAQLRACFDSLPERDGSFDRLLILAGSEESPLRLRWIQWAVDQGTDITLIVERHAADAPIFAGSRRTLEALGFPGIPTGDGNALTRNLFAPDLTGGPGVDVAIVSAADPLAEAEWALRGCMEEERPDQAGIYVRNLETYAPLIEAAAKRLGIPVRIARRAPLLTNSFARLTLAALEFCASNDVRTLGPILQSSYLGLTGEGQARLASGLRECHSMRSMQWETLRTWADIHEEEFPWVGALLEWRQKASGSLLLREWKALVTELICADERFPWSTRIMGRDRMMAERDRRARHQLERLLANFVTVDAIVDERSMTLSEVTAICRRVWKDADVSIPPSSEVGVCVADDPYALTDVETLRVMGMLEGVFPRRRSEEPVLTDYDREEISNLRPGHPPLLNSHDKAEAERDAFYRVCTAARRQLVFSYPLADDSRDNIPAFYLTEVERAAGGHEKVTRKDWARTLLAPLGDECVTENDRILRQSLDAPRESPSAVELISQAARDALRPELGHRFAPGELRDALQCPFQYALRHRLHLRVRRRGARWQSLRKLPQASGLVGKESREHAEHALIEALQAELDSLYSEVPDWEMQLLRAGGRRLIREWLRREFRSREMWPKEIGSIRGNVAFGADGLRDAMPGGVLLEGVVPAVSRHQRYSVAHLYGSGARDPKNLTEVEKLYYGLYFLALHESGREGALEIESMRGKRELVVLTRAGGPVNGFAQDGLSVVDLATADDPALSKKIFFDDVKRALKRAVERIYDSRVDAMKGDHCDWCDYGELCRRSRAFGEEDSPFGTDVVFEDV
ncbi:PD-(D/E)XK nuclease family protein [Fimbriimonas ginsengisoli]|uniref:PD-(D/E)XK nuclease family protein n=1 Tax=Fimbriimonas ginsengisoli TaxID=1005039 RepID=UPI00118631CC|nr:PD-(D/E)XK nuclease family protein [Fimbriimonas ginsengisoli]